MIKPLTIAYNSTNHFLVDCQDGKLLVDAGWARCLPQLRHGLARYGLELSAIKYVMLTHHHPDHAGLTQEVKKATGARLLIHERQIPYLKELHGFYQRKGGYVPIAVERGDLVVKDDGRDALRPIGIRGALVETPGHSEDSISLVLDGEPGGADAVAFTGDLPDQVGADTYEVICESWRKLIALKVGMAYPSHSDPIQIERVAAMLQGHPLAGGRAGLPSGQPTQGRDM